VDKENTVYIDNGVLFSYMKNEFKMFAGKWMELENIMLSKVKQAQISNIARFLTYKGDKCTHT
jgi:hypothetical protein